MSDSTSDPDTSAALPDTEAPVKKARAPRKVAAPKQAAAPVSEPVSAPPAKVAEQLSTEQLRQILAAREAAERPSAPIPESAPPANASSIEYHNTPEPQAAPHPDSASQNRPPHQQPESRHVRRERRNRRDRPRRNRDRDRDRPRPEYGDDNGQESRSSNSEQDWAPIETDPNAPKPEPTFAEGIVEVSGKGFGFVREAKRNFVQSPADVFVTPEVVRRYNLRDGMWIRGETRRGGRGPQLFRLTELEHEDPEKMGEIPSFDELTTINPNERIKLETVSDLYTTRIMDLMTPVGKGQRGLIVAPPRTGKTTLLQHIAAAVVKNYPEMKLIILLVDERPEELTEIRRTVPEAEVMASSNDSDLKSHTRISQLAIERARRLVEMGKDVFLLLDSLTRVGRAFNNAQGGGGRTLSGGMDARAMEIPRKLFAAARNTEEAGSLTILATALIDTGSRMDELIFQEFKGTGNMELVLDRKISDQRTYPAVDIFLSGTRREELLLPPDELHKINVIRRGLAGHKPVEAIERLLMLVRKFPSNAQMLREIPG